MKCNKLLQCTGGLRTQHTICAMINSVKLTLMA